MKYFLGVDGGQSGTTALIANEHGHIVGWATSGPCNHVAASEARARFLHVMGECLLRAASLGHLGRVDGRWPFEAACLGMSGGPEDKAGLIAELVDTPRLQVTHDAMIALAGATAGEPGVVVISGTGSIAFGRNGRGETARTGGWGYVYGDEGSGFDIARQALRAILREHEGWGSRTALTPALLAATGAPDANALLHLFYTPDWPRSRVATLAPLVDQLAEEGEPVAIGILQQAAHHLASIAGAARHQLFMEDEPSRTSWIGGAFSSRTLRERFQQLVSLDSTGPCHAPQHGPAWGALLLAFRAAGSAVTPAAADV
jgi:N-acetylglucosamine kinase-like BadF-type ATPase